ncbi:hypothetical protein OBV_25450 [Oscillibacter valericigenes Sjm18-20]|nr:hypothetical protein OBV_25450 [Oscillibacter valericigenes Sjm18-20]
MSQRKEKYARSMERHISHLEICDARHDSREACFEHTLNTIQAQDAADYAAKIRKSRENVRRTITETRKWRRCTWLAVIALMLCAVLCLTIKVKADAVQPDTGIPVMPVENAPVQEDYENAHIEAALLAKAHKIENCTVTHYAACVECCGKADGITKSGVKATPYVTVAVDPEIIPLGSDVLVDYGDGDIQYYRADDIGEAVKGAHIDLCVQSYAEAVQLGVTTATVYWMAPVEAIL